LAFEKLASVPEALQALDRLETLKQAAEREEATFLGIRNHLLAGGHAKELKQKEAEFAAKKAAHIAKLNEAIASDDVKTATQLRGAMEDAIQLSRRLVLDAAGPSVFILKRDLEEEFLSVGACANFLAERFPATSAGDQRNNKANQVRAFHSGISLFSSSTVF
jgi:hypothetical protein